MSLLEKFKQDLVTTKKMKFLKLQDPKYLKLIVIAL